MNYWDRIENDLRNFIAGPGQEVHMGKKHIFLDYDLSEYADNFEGCARSPWSSGYISQSHRIHIFFSRPNNCIFNDKLARFIELCGEVGARKVIIHTLKTRPLMAKLVKGTVYGLDNCMIVEEEPDKQSLFVNKSDKSGLQEALIGWKVEDEKDDNV